MTGEADVAAAPAGQIDTIAGFSSADTKTTAKTSPKRTIDDAVATDTANPAAAAAAGEPAAKKTSP